MKTPDAKASKGALFYTLLCVCLGVCGYVLYQIAHGLGHADDPFDNLPLVSAGGEDSSSAARRARPTVFYKRDFRDPFQQPPGLFAPLVPRAQRVSKPAASEPPPLSLSGVVDETALLRGEDGSVYIVRAGERVANVQVLKVQRDHVTIRFGGRSHTLKLAQ